MRIIYTILGVLFSIALIAQQDADVPTKDQVIADDLIVQGSIAVGFDANNGENFGYSTVILKENNLRIKFWDTSNSASFPTTDWSLIANDNANGGLNHFSISDDDNGTRPFTVEAGAPTASLYVDDGGRIGLGTATPVVEIHSKDGDTPTLRLEQDGSSGWTPQMWDVAGNETNFFVRDATNGSTLPFRIFPSNPQNTLTLKAGKVGMGTDNPKEQIQIHGGANRSSMLFTNNLSGSTVSDGLYIGYGANGSSVFWNYESDNMIFATGNSEAIRITSLGNIGIGTTNPQSKLAVNGTITAKEVEVTLVGWPDYVFADDYNLKSLSEVETFINENNHLPGVPSEQEILKDGLKIGEMNAILMEKIEELTLYMIDIKKENEAIKKENNEIKSQIKELKK